MSLPQDSECFLKKKKKKACKNSHAKLAKSFQLLSTTFSLKLGMLRQHFIKRNY